MKKILGIIITLLVVFTLISCGGSSGDISVLHEKSYIVKNNVDLQNGYFITTYKAKGLDDVPYLKGEDLKTFWTHITDVNVNVKTEKNILTMSKLGNDNAYVKFDAAKNEVSFKNVGLLAEVSDSQIGQDYCLTAGGDVIKSSNKTKIGTVGKDEAKVSLNEYNIHLYQDNDNVYVPYDLINVLLQPSSLVPYVFNGKDFCKNPDSYENTEVTSMCYSGNGMFEYGYLEAGYRTYSIFKMIKAKDNQKYTYQTIDSYGNPNTSSLYEIALYKDGKGVIMDVNSNTELKDNENRITKIKYKEDNGYLILYLSKAEKESTIEPTEDVFDQKLVINLGQTRFAKKERSQAVADFTYNLLCLAFDNVYSVKEAKNISSFDKFFTDKGYKDNLKSTNIDTYEEAFFKLLTKEIDDGHTSIDFLSIYDYPGKTQIGILYDKYPPTHARGINDKANLYYSDRHKVHNFASDAMKIVGDTCYLSFDNFILNYGFPSNFKTYSLNPDLEELRNNDTCGYMAASIIKIEEYNKNDKNNVKIKNIVVDISANTGGIMTVLPYVACIMTKDPMLCVGDSRTGQVVEFHYEADFDGDGVYGDTYADKYNFFLLTSDASFSCGSSLPSMLKGTNVKIIGKTGAGGASPITSFTDASGFGYKSSGQLGIYYKDGNTYKTIENGVPVDYELDQSLWYDYDKLTNKIHELVNNAK